MCKFKNGGTVGETNPHRLDHSVVPESYQIVLAPDLANATFSGEVTIKVNVNEPKSEIVLNANELEVQSASVSNEAGTSFDGTVSLESETQRVRVKVNGVVGKGEWTLKLAFTGILNDKLRGFYRSTYKDDDGSEQVIATTQFESTDARRAFPCFDQPDLKAVYQISLIVDEDLAAVSNTRVVSEKLIPGSRAATAQMILPGGCVGHVFGNIAKGKKIVTFAPTMKMSTYLVAFVVGKLVSSQTVHVDGIPVRVWCRPGKEHLTTFALKAAQHALRYYKRYFGVPYPGDKLDMLAIPDFAAGAMENLGCVTYREGALLCDEEHSSQDALDYVAHVVNHELAHMWFGDLVTMKWWNGIWLNEAFATFMENKCTDAWRKAWGTWDKFGLDRNTAFRTDGLGSTRPVEFVVNSPEDAEGMFDVLTYEKGCSVMRMLEQYLGEETFQKGIALYIQTHAYGNTETADLWAAISTASGQNVGEIMQQWIFTPGYPVVNVSLSDADGSIVLGQSNFKFLSEKMDLSLLWQIPVMLRAKTADGVIEQKLLLTERDQTVYIGEDLEWVVVNAGGHGFYRVTYSSDLRAKLTANVQDNLSVIERVNLVSDTWAAVQAGRTSATEFIELAKLFGDETDPNVWDMLTTGLVPLKKLLPKENRPSFEQMVRDIVGPLLKKVGLTRAASDEKVRQLRSTLFQTMAITGDCPVARQKAAALYESWKKDRTSVDANLVDAVVKIAAATGDANTYEEFLSFYKGADTPDEEDRFMYGLAGFRDLALLKRTLGYAIDPSVIRTQDGGFVVARVLGNEVGAEAGWQFVEDNFATMAKLYPNSVLLRMVQGTPALNTPELEARVKAFLAANPVPGAGKAVDQTLEMLHIAVQLRNRESAALAAAFPVVTTGGDTGSDSDQPNDGPDVITVVPHEKKGDAVD